MNVSVVIGTRPEAIKLAPVIRELNSRAGVHVNVVATAQHRELLDQALEIFSIEPRVDLSAMQTAQNLAALTARMLATLEGEFTTNRPDVVVVQGDTTTVFAASLAAFYSQYRSGMSRPVCAATIPISPFRKKSIAGVATILARWHFAPTELARENLLNEGIDASRIFVTGNTVVDALHSIVDSDRFRLATLPIAVDPSRRLMLVTLHRRESWGEPLHWNVPGAPRSSARATPMCRSCSPCISIPPSATRLKKCSVRSNESLCCEPLDYVSFLQVMQASTFVMTDSGGVQEEAPVFGRPVLVLRETHRAPGGDRRRRGQTGGHARRGHRRRSVSLARRSRGVLRPWRERASPFGDGHAAGRIADVLVKHLSRASCLMCGIAGLVDFDGARRARVARARDVHRDVPSRSG